MRLPKRLFDILRPLAARKQEARVSRPFRNWLQDLAFLRRNLAPGNPRARQGGFDADSSSINAMFRNRDHQDARGVGLSRNTAEIVAHRVAQQQLLQAEWIRLSPLDKPQGSGA